MYFQSKKTVICSIEKLSSKEVGKQYKLVEQVNITFLSKIKKKLDKHQIFLHPQQRVKACVVFWYVCLSGGLDPHGSHLSDRSYQNREDARSAGVQSHGGQRPRSAPPLSCIRLLFCCGLSLCNFQK